MLPWIFFATGLADASNSLISNANLVSKVYFPRMIVPIATIVVAFVDFLISFAMLLAVDGLVSFLSGMADRAFALFHAARMVATLGPALWITALNVKYRDFRYIIPFYHTIWTLCFAGRL